MSTSYRAKVSSTRLTYAPCAQTLSVTPDQREAASEGDVRLRTGVGPWVCHTVAGL